MANSQPAIQPSSNNREFGSIPRPIDLEHVSVSQLLGRDYIFIDTQYAALPTHDPDRLNSMLDDLIAQLGLAEAHTVAISVQELSGNKVSFTRHDLTWHKHKICRVESTDITQPEQYEFMEMIWHCSTSVSPV